MSSQRLRGRALDCLQLQRVHLLQVFEFTVVIVEALLGHGPAMHTQRELGGFRTEIAGLLGQVFGFSHFGDLSLTC